MKPVHWKLTTFASLGAAAFFALHPLQTSGSSNESAKSVKHQNGFLGSLFGIGEGDEQSPTHHVGQKLVALQTAKTNTAMCEAMNALGPQAAGDEEATSALGERTTDKYPFEVRVCAIGSLGYVKTGAARTWLGDLLNDGNREIRQEAIRVLATDEDPEARRMVMTVARSGDADDRYEALLALGEAHVAEAGPLIAQEIQKTSDYEKQSQLIEALGQSGSPDAAQVLLSLAQTGSAGVRTSALSALGNVGGESASSVLQQALQNGNRQEVDIAANALARMGNKQALIAAASDPRRSVSVAALRAMVSLDGEDVRGVMSRALDSPEHEVASAAVQWFSAKRDDSSVQKLSDLAQNGSAFVRSQALSGLRGIGSDNARVAIEGIASKPGPLQGEALNELSNMPGGADKARTLAISLVRDQGGQSATYAINLLAQDGSPEARQALVDAAKSGNGNASSAIQALAQHADADSMHVLADLSEHAKTKDLREEALRAIGQTGDPKAAPLLVRAMKDQDPHIQRAALAALEGIGGPDAERAIADATTSSDVGLKMYAVTALGRVGTPSATASLERLAQDKDANTARVALQTLAQTAPARASGFVDRAMRSDDPRTRVHALEAASNLDAQTAKRVALAGLKDNDTMVVSSAIRHLQEMGGPDAQSALVDVLTGTASEDTKREAADALQEMGGEATRRFSNLIDKYKSPVDDEEDDDRPIRIHRGSFRE